MLEELSIHSLRMLQVEADYFQILGLVEESQTEIDLRTSIEEQQIKKSFIDKTEIRTLHRNAETMRRENCHLKKVVLWLEKPKLKNPLTTLRKPATRPPPFKTRKTKTKNTALRLRKKSSFARSL